ncbi:MAG: folylpolyglutamate synthase/dihydrofolate synthase family protein [Pseudomonadota bacterium]
MSADASDVILERLLTLHPKLMDLSLGRLERLLAILDHPERKLPPVVHVAGTNGKGSTIAMIRAGLEASGAKVHVYTSPHLARFHERIRLCSKLIDEDSLAALLAECETANGGAPITFFEVTTAAALLAFSRTPADYCLLEVGLGGRLDATNVIDHPALTVITPVSLDHQQFLGETLAEIAGEKAGIIKRDVSCVVSRQEDEARDVIEARAERLGAPLLLSGQDFSAELENGRMVYRDEHGLLDLDPPRLRGDHQIINAGAALAALRSFGISDQAMEAAIAEAKWPARMQRLSYGPLFDLAHSAEADLWLDGGHNEAAGEAIAAFFSGLPPARTHVIASMLDTKDLSAFLYPISTVAQGLTAVPMSGTTQLVPPETLAGLAAAAGLEASTSETVTVALDRALAEGAKRVLVTGSLYLAGDVLRAGNG